MLTMASEQVFNIKFVAEIEKRPELYDYTRSEYSRKDITEKAWTEVSEQVGMTVGECKERWKNLRAVFVRHLKPGLGDSAFKRKKPYYLTEAMQFTLPFIKSVTASPASAPEIFKQERCVNSGNSDNEDSGTGQKSPSPASLRPSQSTPSPLLLPITPVVNLQEQRTSSEQHAASKDVVRHDTVDNSFAEYLGGKRAKLATTKQSSGPSPRSEALKMFLLSMLPDLESMTDVQVRKFKRRCLETIDDILTSPSYPPSTPASRTAISSLSSSNTDNSSIPLNVPSNSSQDESDATKQT
ncbi:uncharacterized protein LOC126455572 [Schistocerca serialis cubense]|uniref:uncharacterized protein LOC126455572 n=1 Tax=Schistocerca serialis cubense TaxID=2023355 RepID=UPI00214F4B01|nr:uncharacterized protein LOC126455572 [Schistocerca serialis cubense]